MLHKAKQKTNIMSVNCTKMLTIHTFYWPNMAVKGTFCPNALFKLGAPSVVSDFFYPYPRAKRPLLLR